MLRAAVHAGPSRFVLRDAEVSTGDRRGRITINLGVVLDRWSFRNANPIQLDVTATTLSLGDFRALASLPFPVSGELSGNVAVRGSLLHPVGRGKVEITQSTVAGEAIQAATVLFEADGNTIRTQFLARIASGSATGELSYFPSRNAYAGRLQVSGIQLDQLGSIRSRDLRIAGALDAFARGRGTLQDPGLEFIAQIPQLQIHDQTLRNVTLRTDVANHIMDFVLDSQVLDGFLRGRGHLSIRDEYRADAAFETSRLDLQPLLTAYFPALTSKLAVHAQFGISLSGPLKNPSDIAARIRIPALVLSYGNDIQLEAEQPIQLDYSNGVLTLGKTEFRGTGTDFYLEGVIPLNGAQPGSLNAQGAIDLQLTRLLNPNITTSGTLRFSIAARGERTNPNVQGTIHVADVNVAGYSLPPGLQSGNGVLTLSGKRLEIDRFQGRVSSGTLTATGSVDYWPSLQFNLLMAANGVRLFFPPGIREGLDANLTLTGSPRSAALKGHVLLKELFFLPTFDLAEVFSEVLAARKVPAEGFARDLNLDVTVQSQSDLSAASSQLSVQGGVHLRVLGTVSDPALLGRVDLSGGDLIFRSNRYVLLPGTVEFVNPNTIEPRVSIGVETRAQRFNIQLLFRGPVDQLRTTYSSEPPLPPADIVNLLVFGNTRASSATSPALGNLGAESLIAASVTETVTNRIERVTGISQISIDPVLGFSQQDIGARVTIQQRVTGNLFVTFTSDATSTQRQVVQLEYQATPRLALSAVRNQNGGFALDIRLRSVR